MDLTKLLLEFLELTASLPHGTQPMRMWKKVPENKGSKEEYHMIYIYILYISILIHVNDRSVSNKYIPNYQIEMVERLQ